jgi:hypothetical protein
MIGERDGAKIRGEISHAVYTMALLGALVLHMDAERICGDYYMEITIKLGG